MACKCGECARHTPPALRRALEQGHVARPKADSTLGDRIAADDDFRSIRYESDAEFAEAFADIDDNE